MSSSLRFANVFGIPLKVHITFPLILIWGMLQFGLATGLGWTGALFGVIITLLLFGIVILHELGHSVAALYYDVPVEEIIMLPIGGVARIRDIPEESGKEFVIAIAGPLVNFAIAGILYGLYVIGAVPINFGGPAALLTNLDAITVGVTLGYLWYVNLFVAVFNLIPAFPMDGGRVLRALLGLSMPYSRATQIATSIGQGLAWLFGIFGFFSGNLFLIVIAFFVYIGANQEGTVSRQRVLLDDMTVEEAYSREAQVLSPDTPLQTAVDKTLSSFQQDFPVCDGDRLIGLLPYKRILEASSKNLPDTPVREVMVTSFETIKPTDDLFEVQKRMMEEQIEALPVLDGERLVGLLTNRDVREVLQLAAMKQKSS